jgi:acyl-[acyl-carrier-protein]-phospholipid O-acyltransferase/long-chain-fatty-acid--[acyl-carrier-protein] ligase
MSSQFLLLRERRFWPFFLVQCGGAFNDNLMKTAVVVLIAYGLWDTGGANAGALVALASALFILPFVLFCPWAGDLTDKYSKNSIIKCIKAAEIAIVLLAIPALFWHSTALAFVILLALGTHSAFFSPAKFAILPQHLREEELIAGNGLVGTGTYLSILAGTILGALLAPREGGLMLISVLLLLVSFGGLAAGFLIPPAPPPSPDLPLRFNPFRSFTGAISTARRQTAGVLPALLGVSWFYFVASGFHAQFPNFAKQAVAADTDVLTLFMVVFSVGIGIGGMANNALLRAKIDSKFAPWGMLGAGLFGLDLCLAASGFGEASQLATLSGFMSAFSGWRILLDLFGLAFSGGLYVIPLRALVQHRARQQEKARVVAANSMLDALFILLSSVLAMGMLAMGLSVLQYFTTLSLACLVAAALLFRKGSL